MASYYFFLAASNLCFEIEQCGHLRAALRAEALSHTRARRPKKLRTPAMSSPAHDAA